MVVKNKILISLLIGGLLSPLLSAESFYDKSSFRPLVADNRAHQIGDNLTVLIVESTQAGTRAGTGSSSAFDSNFDISAGSYDSVEQSKVGAAAGLGYDRDSKDSANTSREGHFSGQLAVRVVDIDEHGMMSVVGMQSLTVNGERQLVRVSGLVRVMDVRADNTVLSTRMSDAQIEFNGKGAVSDGQEPNIFSKFFNIFGL